MVIAVVAVVLVHIRAYVCLCRRKIHVRVLARQASPSGSSVFNGSNEFRTVELDKFNVFRWCVSNTDAKSVPYISLIYLPSIHF